MFLLLRHGRVLLASVFSDGSRIFKIHIQIQTDQNFRFVFRMFLFSGFAGENGGEKRYGLTYKLLNRTEYSAFVFD